MFSGSVDADFVLTLPFHHGDLEPDCVRVSMGGGLMRGIKMPPQDFPLKMQGGLMCEGGRICGTQWYHEKFACENSHLFGTKGNRFSGLD